PARRSSDLERGAQRPVESGGDRRRGLPGDGERLRRGALPDRAACELDLGDHVLDRLGAAGGGDEGAQQRGAVAVGADRDHVQWIRARPCDWSCLVAVHGTLPGHSADISCAAARPRKVARNEPMSAISTPTGTSCRLKALATTGAEAMPPMFAVEETAIENRSVWV